MALRSIIPARAFLALCITAPHLLVAAERYAVTPLPFIPFSDTGGEALSSSGVVAGGIVNADGSVALAEWSNGALTRLGVPPGLPTHEFSRLAGIRHQQRRRSCGHSARFLRRTCHRAPSSMTTAVSLSFRSQTPPTLGALQ